MGEGFCSRGTAALEASSKRIVLLVPSELLDADIELAKGIPHLAGRDAEESCGLGLHPAGRLHGFHQPASFVAVVAVASVAEADGTGR